MKRMSKQMRRDSITQFTGKYFFLSNYFQAPITYAGITYDNNEAAFQSAKTIDLNKRMKFSNLPPNRAKSLGRHITLRDDWEDVKFDVMYDVCVAKFTQNEDLKKKLLDTNDAYLEEGNTWGDCIWGTCNGVGENHLGKILMRIREELKK